MILGVVGNSWGKIEGEIGQAATCDLSIAGAAAMKNDRRPLLTRDLFDTAEVPTSAVVPADVNEADEIWGESDYVADGDAEVGGTIGFTMQHVATFVRCMLPLINVTIASETHDGSVLEVRLPEEMRGLFAEFAQKTVVRVTTDRRLAQRMGDVVLLDFESEFFRHLIEHAKSQKFDGLYTSIATGASRGSLAAFKLRWQNDQGEPLTEEFLPIFLGSDGRTEVNPAFLTSFLIEGASAGASPNTPVAERNATFQRLVDRANRRLADESTRFKHPNGLVYLAAADCQPV